METPILAVRHLTTRLQNREKTYAVVNDLSFDLHLGKTTALVGESGCGKTLAALSLMRILPTPPALPSTGEVIFQNQNLLTLSEREMRRLRGGSLAMIFQDPSSALNPVYTIGDQLFETVRLHRRLEGGDAYECMISALKEVGIPDPENCIQSYPHQLSGGMKQRAMIAMALIGEPQVLIADEPTTALDVTIQAQVLELIRQLQERRGMAVLLITHDAGVVAEMADDVVVMYASESMETGSVYDIFDHRAHPYTRGLFDSLSGFNTPGMPLNPIPGNVPPATQFPNGCKFHPRCSFVMDKCREGKIPNFPIDSESHQARCLLYDGTTESDARRGR